MVRKTLKALTNKISGLQEAAFWLAGFSVLSQLLAFLRDRLLAQHFGASLSLDLYYASFEVPDLIFTTAASLVSASILVPLFAKWGHEKSIDAKKHIDSIFTSFFILLTVCSVIAWVLMPFLVPLFFKNLGLQNLEKVIHFSRILLLSPFFLGLSNFFGSIIQYQKRFLLYSLSPLLYNVGIIFGIVFGAQSYGIIAVIVGVSFGAFMHMLIQALWVYLSDNGPRLIKKIDLKEVRKTFSLSVPRTVSLSASSLVGLFFVSLASKFPEGSIAVYNFSFNLQSVPLVIIGASYSLAAFPTLASHYVKNEMEDLKKCLADGLRYIIFWSLPVASLFIVLRAHIVRVVLGSGEFNWDDTRMTAAVLAIFVVSLIFQSIQLFLTRAHYAFGKTRLPLFINVFTALLTIFLGLFFTKYLEVSGAFFTFISQILKVQGLLRLSVLSLPLAFSIGSLISALLLFVFLEKSIRKGIFDTIFVSFLRSLIAALAVSAGTTAALRLFSNVFSLDSLLGVFGHAFFSGLVGIVCGILTLIIFRSKEYSEIMAKFK